MFENLLHQDSIAGRLRHDVAEGMLPPAILLSGPSMAGKLTAALEVARALSCEEDARWNCPCIHCRSHRALANPHTLLAGFRDMTPEISASAEVLRRDDSDAPRFLLVRSARKLLRRFDPVLWGGDEKKPVKARAMMERLAATVDNILPGKALPEGKKLEKLLDSLVDDCAVLQKSLPSVLPVSQVRHITSWAVHSAGTDHKTVIIDGADRMPDASRNALLKFLEEPPAGTTAILISDRKAMLLPTIVSRLRDYSFRSRRPAEEAEVLRRVFREDEKRWKGLKEYFRAWKIGPSERMMESAAAFLDSARRSDSEFPSEAAEIKDQSDLIVFLDALGSELRRRWLDTDTPNHRRSAMEVDGIRQARVRAESLNLPSQLILRGLYLSFGGKG